MKQKTSIKEWRCTSCCKLNRNDRNKIPCTNCYILDSEINIKRAKQLYILGNINNPSVSFIPLKIPFFIYPLSPPIIKYTIQYQQEKEVIINFEVELWDNKHIENYHVECIKIDSYLKGTELSTIINAKTPYYNIFPFHIKHYESGFQTIQIYAKCYGSKRISPKQSLQILLSPSNSNDIGWSSSSLIAQNSTNHNGNNICSSFGDGFNVNNSNEYRSNELNGTKDIDVDEITNRFCSLNTTIGDWKYSVTKTTFNQYIQRNMKTIVSLVNDRNDISENVCSIIATMTKNDMENTCIYNELNAINLIRELLKRGQRSDCNHSLIISIHEGINNIIHFMSETDINHHGMLESLLAELVKIMMNNLEKHIKNRDVEIIQYRFRGLFSSVHVLLNKLGPNYSLKLDDSNKMIYCCCNVLNDDNINVIDGVYEEGLGLIACISRSIDIDFRIYLETAPIQELLIKSINIGIRNKSICRVVVGCIGDVYAACTDYISTNPSSLQSYSHRIVSELKSILINDNISIELKSNVVDALSDIIISHGKYAEKYIDDILDKCLEIGCLIPSQTNDQQMNGIKCSIIDLCRSCLAELPESNKINNFNKYIPKINQFFKAIYDDINRTNINVLKSVIKLLCEVDDYCDIKTTKKLCNPFTQKLLLKARSKNNNDDNDGELAKYLVSMNKIINLASISTVNDSKEDEENKVDDCWYFINDDGLLQPISDNLSQRISRMKQDETKMISIGNWKYSVTKTKYNQCTQKNTKTNKMRELRLEEHAWFYQYKSIVSRINDKNKISEKACWIIRSLTKYYHDFGVINLCIYNESNAINLIRELLKRGKRNDCNHSLLIGIYEGINNIIHFMPETDANHKMLQSLLPELAKMMNNLQKNTKNEDNDRTSYRLSGLFSFGQVLLDKLGPNCLKSDDSNKIMNCCCNVVNDDNINIVGEEAFGLIISISRSIDVKFHIYLETKSVQELLIKSIGFGTNHESIRRVGVLCIGYVYTACTDYISTNPLSLHSFSDRIVSELKSMLINVKISIELKSYVINTLTDILISHEKYAIRYSGDILNKCLGIKHLIPPQTANQEMMSSFNELRCSIIDLCRSCLVELAQSNKVNNFNKYIPKINQFVKKAIYDDINRTNINVLKSVIKLLCEAGDYCDIKTRQKLRNCFTQKILLKAESKKQNDPELAKYLASIKINGLASTKKSKKITSSNKSIISKVNDVKKSVQNEVVDCWYFKSDDGKFQPISDDLSQIISRMKLGETKNISIKNWKYLVTKTMYNQCTQRNTTSNKVRELRLNVNDNDDQKDNVNQSQQQQADIDHDGSFVSHISYQDAMKLQIGDKIDIRYKRGKIYEAKICEIEVRGNQQTLFIKIHYEGFVAKYDEWINIDKQLYNLSLYKSISRRPCHRLNNVTIGDFIDVNPIYIDPGWKPAEIINMHSLSGEIEVKFKHSTLKQSTSYWLHLDNTIECDEFGKGDIDKKQVEALFFATISPSKYKIIEIKDVCSKNSINIYESILRGKEKEIHEIEKYLWHGTKIDVLPSILKNGFDRSYNTVGKYGKGTYFAKNSAYSVEGGYCGKDENNLHFILLCRVIVGEYIEGKENMKKIPKRINGMEYDSLVNNKNNPKIFVCWRDYHAIPYYLIKFKSL